MSFLGEQGCLLSNFVQKRIEDGIPQEFLPLSKVFKKVPSTDCKRKRTPEELIILANVRKEHSNFQLDIIEENNDKNRRWWEYEEDAAESWRYQLTEARYKRQHRPSEWSEYDWRQLWYHSTSDDANLPF